MIDISVILNTCFLCFIASTIISENSDDTDTCTFIFVVLGCIFALGLLYIRITGGD